MEDNKVKANFQFLDSYIRNSNIEIYVREDRNSKLEMNIEVNISEIKKNDENKELSAELRLRNLVEIFDKENEQLLTKIDVEMAGVFSGKNMNEEDFSKFMKYSGTPILSQAIRAYIMSISSLSGIRTIRLPLINYVEFFKNSDKK